MVKQEIQFALVTKGNRVAVIAHSQVLQPEVKFRRGRVSDGLIVFVSGNGQPFAINVVNSFLLNMEKAYNKAHQEETIPHLSAHILRHTGCTLLASAGMDIKVLQNVMGHSDASITMNVYNHSSFERSEKEVQRIDNVINF